MHKSSRLALVLTLANVGIYGTLPAHAQARDVIEQATVTRTDAYIAKHAPNVVDHCKGAPARFVVGLKHDGEANGWRAVMQGDIVVSWRWDPTKCDISLRSGMHDQSVKASYFHERLHYIVGPEHVGLLKFPVHYPAWTDCQDGEDCWVWSQMGNQTRGKVYVKGSRKPRNADSDTFRTLRIKKRIDWKRTPRMKGDYLA